MTKKNEFLSIAIIFVGVLGVSSILLRDYLRGLEPSYGIYDKGGMIVAAVFVVIGLLSLVFNRYELCRKNVLFSAEVNLFQGILVFILVATLCSVGGLLYGYYYHHPSVITPPRNWSIGIYTSSSREPFDFTGEDVNNPVLTADDVTDVEAILVADPFLVYENGVFYMFFEVWNAVTNEGDIALAISNDGLNWSYQQVVLDEPFVLSYPCVFKWDGEYYMIPDSYQTKSVRLYKATNFPYGWSFIKTLLKGKDFVDNTIFHYSDTWWLFTETRYNDLLRLYFADSPLGPWTEHVKSPVVEGNNNIARPGGNVVVFDGRVVRYAQDDYPYYGNQVWALEVTTLTREDYQEKRIGSKPILKGFDNWNTQGMHTISSCRLGPNKWIASVDGY